MRKILFITIYMLILTSASFAQRTWIDLEMQKKIAKNLSFSLAPEIRLDDNYKLKEYLATFELDYEINKYFEVAGSYRMGNNINSDGEHEFQTRFAFDAKGAYEIKKLEASLRVRFTDADDFEEDETVSTKYLRYRLKLKYDISNIKLSPYLSYEIYSNLSDNIRDKARYEAGMDYRLNKKNKLGVYYRINDYLNNDKSFSIIGLSYRIKL